MVTTVVVECGGNSVTYTNANTWTVDDQGYLYILHITGQAVGTHAEGEWSYVRFLESA